MAQSWNEYAADPQSPSTCGLCVHCSFEPESDICNAHVRAPRTMYSNGQRFCTSRWSDASLCESFTYRAEPLLTETGGHTNA